VSATALHPSASFSATLRVHLDNRPGAFATLAKAIGDAGGLLGAIDLVRVEHGKKIRDVTVLADDDAHIARIVEAVRAVDGIDVEHVSDRTFLLHLGGKLEVVPKSPLKTRDDLSMAYTPGVARVSRAIAEDPEKVWNLTVKQNTVAVVTDGTAVLGLGDIGPEAALPVMEGKAVLFKEFGGIDAWPVCLDTNDPDEIVRTVKLLAPVFGGINLEDISAPRCFEIESRLRAELEIPVFHDDQHGTAIVVLAALLNALRIVDKSLEDVRIVITARVRPAQPSRGCCSRRGRAGSSAPTGAAFSVPAGMGSTSSSRRLRRRRTAAASPERRTTRSRAPMSSSGSRRRARSRRLQFGR
jgi:malate dehydrogenase (oxaloacetate-decarboxylating)